MSLQEIKEGDKLKIRFKREDRPDQEYISRLQTVIDDKTMIVYTPIVIDQFMHLPIEDAYIFTFYTDNCILKAGGVILEYFMEDSYDFMKIRLTSGFERVQRRNFFRLACVMPFKFTKEHGEGAFRAKDRPLHHGIIKDLGGGGIRFISNTDLVSEEMIECSIVLNRCMLSLEARVLDRQEILEPNSHYKYQYRAEFTDIDRSKQEHIVHYIFEEQWKIIKRLKIL